MHKLVGVISAVSWGSAGEGAPAPSPSPAAAHENSSPGERVTEQPLWIFNAMWYLAFAESTFSPRRLSSIHCSYVTCSSSTQPFPAWPIPWDQLDPEGTARRQRREMLPDPAANLCHAELPKPPSRLNPGWRTAPTGTHSSTARVGVSKPPSTARNCCSLPCFAL